MCGYLPKEVFHKNRKIKDNRWCNLKEDIEKEVESELSQKYLKECLIYSPAAGTFTWLERPRSHFKNEHTCRSWNSNYSNKKAGGMNSIGYIAISLDHNRLLAHRLAFLYMKGYFPQNGMDHKNRIRDDNRWCNLRECNQFSKYNKH